MNSSDENIKLLFLLDGSFSALPPSYTKLRSYFNTYTSQIAHRYKLNIPPHLISKSNTCPFCFTSWSNDTSSFKLVPAEKNSAKKKKLKKRLKKLGGEPPVPKQPKNKMVIKCLVCRKASIYPVCKKPKKLRVKNNEDLNNKNLNNKHLNNKDLNSKDLNDKEVIKKKKKKKDKTCGLKMDKVPELQKPKDSQKKENKANNFNKSVNSSSKKPEKHFNKKVAGNPVAANIQKKVTKKDKNKLMALRNKIKENKSSTKKTLEGFLSLVKT